jgi:hypothetical protein
MKENNMQLGKIALDRRYWRGAGHELVELRLAVEVKPRLYRVIEPLPSKESLEVMVAARLYTRTLESWYDDAKGDEEALKEEMTSWCDNLDGGGLGSTSKFEEVSQAADSLEAQDLPEVPEALREVPVTVYPAVLVVSCPWCQAKRRTGRSWRHGEALGILAEVLNVARAEVQGWKHGSAHDAAEEFIEEVQSYIDEVESVDFPGMY